MKLMDLLFEFDKLHKQDLRFQVPNAGSAVAHRSFRMSMGTRQDLQEDT